MSASPARQKPALRRTAVGPRDRIVTAARRYFFAHGFRPVTMEDLATVLGMSKKTLYASFPSKASLVKAVLRQKFVSIEHDLHRITSRMQSGSSDVANALHDLLACVQRHTEEIQPPFVRDIGRDAPDLFHVVEGRRRALIRRHFGRLFEVGHRQGLFRTDIPPRLMIEMLLGATQAIMNPPKMAELGLTPKTGYSTILTMVLEGLLRRPDGRKAKR